MHRDFARTRADVFVFHSSSNATSNGAAAAFKTGVRLPATIADHPAVQNRDHAHSHNPLNCHLLLSMLLVPTSTRVELRAHILSRWSHI
jgi:hypothetical protein